MVEWGAGSLSEGYGGLDAWVPNLEGDCGLQMGVWGWNGGVLLRDRIWELQKPQRV